MKRNSSLVSLVITALLLALGIVLPFLTAQIKVLGQAISPLHIPVLICGLTCGPVYGAVLGVVLPLLRSLMFGMPPLFPTATAMSFEMCAYGLLTGICYKVLRRVMKGESHLPAMLCAMLIAMVAGRIVGGAAQAVFMGMRDKPYTFQMFVSSYFVGTAVGAVIHLIVVPVVVLALEKAKLSPNA